MKKSRIQQINDSLLQNIDTIYCLRNIQYSTVNNKICRAYIVTFAKNHINSLEEMTLSLYDFFKSFVSSNEILTTDNKCFKITSHDFEITYYIEAWRKRADKTAYIKDGKVVTELIYRMGCEQAAYILKKYRVKPLKLLNSLEVLQKYTNPAEKYVALAKTTAVEEE